MKIPGGDLLPEWQKRYVDAVLSGEYQDVSMSVGRSGGRRWAHRYALWGALALGGHVHVLARDGMWCVTGTGEQLATFGPLWEKLEWPPREPEQEQGVIWDEAQEFMSSP